MDQLKRRYLSPAARRSRRAHYARLLRNLGRRIVPARASTQTWMILTFSLFVGLAAVAVALYVGFVLRREIVEATREVIIERAERVARAFDTAPSAAARAQLAAEVHRITGYEISLIPGTALQADAEDARGTAYAVLLDQPEMQGAREHRAYLHRRPGPGGHEYYFLALYRPAPDLIVHIGQPVPPLLGMVRRVVFGFVLAMVAILLLALLGSWVAARQVIKPLQAIRDSARRISEEKFDARIHVESRAVEFQDLANRLNHMSSSFREKIVELQRLAQLQNEFIGNVSHEVRNPIFAVGGYLEALGTNGLREEQRKRYVEKGLANLQRLNNLFNDLIEIARLEYREDLIQPRVFDLQELVDEIGDMLRPKAEDKGLRLELDNEPVEVHADRNRIRQVLINLIDNGIAYSDEGVVRCRFRRHLDKVRVEVIDTGRGIPEEHLDRVFERFYRVDPDRSRKSGGTGLGLSIVRQILHAHGESIHVESTFGRGTRFWFELPYARVGAETAVA